MLIKHFNNKINTFRPNGSFGFMFKRIDMFDETCEVTDCLKKELSLLEDYDCFNHVLVSQNLQLTIRAISSECVCLFI